MLLLAYTNIDWYIKEVFYENCETYGNLSSAYWKTVDIHHIRPRVYNGGNEFSNLMPVERTAHRRITTWFVNY